MNTYYLQKPLSLALTLVLFVSFLPFDTAFASQSSIGKARLIAPSGNIEESQIKSLAYQWHSVKGAKKYKIKVFKDNGEITIDSNWFPVKKICKNGICEIVPEKTLGPGSYTWQVKAQKTSKQSKWSNSLQFIIQGTEQTPPNTPTPTLTQEPTNEPTLTATLTQAPTQEPTSTAIPTQEPTNTPEPTATPTQEPTNPEPTATSEPADTSTFYVSPDGNDSNSGTQDQPWRSIQKAANTASAGQTVTVLSGDYPERVIIQRSGSSGEPITFQAQGTVVTRGFTILADFVTIRNFEITDTPNDSRDGWGIFADGSNNIIENNFVYFATRGGISLFIQPGDETNTSNSIVRNNQLYKNALTGIEVSGRDNLVEANEIWGTIQYHPKWSNPPNWVDADGIRFFGSGHIIRQNYIHDILYTAPENVNPHIDCFQTWGDGSYHEQASNIVFDQNWCANSQSQAPNESGQGFMLENASNLLIRNNIIQAYRGVNAVNSNAIRIVNNIFANSLDTTAANHPSLLGFTQSPNSVIKNNIFYNPLVHSIYFHDSTSRQGLEVGFNDYYRSDGAAPQGSPYPNDLWMVKPAFVDPTNGNFHLRSESPLIDAGTSTSLVPNDFDGNYRPFGNSHDIGADEFSQ